MAASPVAAAGPLLPQNTLTAQNLRDDWPEDFSRLLDNLTAMLCVVRSADDSLPLKVETVSDLYRAGGFPPTVDRLAGQLVVASTHKMLQSDPGYLPEQLRQEFATDLRNMYKELGGNPLLLE